MSDRPAVPLTRREFIRASSLLAGAGALGGSGWWNLAQAAFAARGPMLTRTIPSSGEALPVIGMGSYLTFDVGRDPALRDDRAQVLAAFFERGGGVIDSSPMYGSSEEVIGSCLAKLDVPPAMFSATKIWTWCDRAGPGQMEDSFRLWGVETLDLLQVHNLLNWKTHLGTIRAARAAGRIRYVGVTTSHGRRHDELERMMRREPLDFVQLTYNLLDREAEERLLPLAQDRGMAVIANRPFRRKALIAQFKRHPLPAWAAEFDAATWPQFLLKFVVSHPAVTCAIPATSRVDHMQENMGALYGRLPDAALRRRMIDYVAAL